ncbi:MAG: rhamnogalacturonan acetylesterase [Chitinophagaceae bacterium]|nr:rhamnogalacturonan acetylesterase [Chitinophagaceae bacterium]
MRKTIVILIVLATMTAFSFPPARNIRIWMIGDSTMSIKDKRTYPETGWGMSFVHFWDSTVTIDNRAKNGRSTKSFRDEGLWEPVMNGMQEGDYVIIQFGHNDEVPTKKTYTTEMEFRNLLVQYINEARSKRAIPLLLTPAARRKFDSTGKVVGTHDVYSQIVRDVAAIEKTILIDLDRKSQALYQQLGVDGSKWLFNHLAPGEHPNYPEGKIDDTHFSEVGARKIAGIVLGDIRVLIPDLAARVISKTPK